MRTTANVAAAGALVMAIALAGCHDTTAPTAIVPVPALTAQNSVVGIPPGWTGYLGQPASFTVGVESAAAHSGAHAAFMTNGSSVVSGTTFAQISELVRAGSYAGHRVMWSGWVRATDVDLPIAAAAAAGAPPPVSGLWMRVDGSDSSFAFDNMQRRPVIGTTGWQQVSVVLDVPSNAVGIQFGAIFSGSGQLLVDDLALTIIDSSVTTTNLDNGPQANANIGAMYQNASAAPTNLDFETTTQASAALQPNHLTRP